MRRPSALTGTCLAAVLLVAGVLTPGASAQAHPADPVRPPVPAAPRPGPSDGTAPPQLGPLPAPRVAPPPAPMAGPRTVPMPHVRPERPGPVPMPHVRPLPPGPVPMPLAGERPVGGLVLPGR